MSERETAMRNNDRLDYIPESDTYGLPTAFDLDGAPIQWEWFDYGLTMTLDYEDGAVVSATFRHDDVPEATVTVKGETLNVVGMFGPEAACSAAVGSFAEIAEQLDRHDSIPEDVVARLSSVNPDTLVALV
jgi:hypothetical protein